MVQLYFVGSLPLDLTDHDLYSYFSSVGKVLFARVFIDRLTGRGKGFGYVVVESNCYDPLTLNNTELNGRTIFLDVARPIFNSNRPSSFKLPADILFKLDVPPDPIIEINKCISTELIKLIYFRPQYLYEISSRKFEELICSLFESFGYQVELTKNTRDGGKDLIVKRKAEVETVFYIECKRYKPENSIGVGIVRELHSVVTTDKVNKGIIATTSCFTSDASKYIKTWEPVLESVDKFGIYNWIESFMNNNMNNRWTSSLRDRH